MSAKAKPKPVEIQPSQSAIADKTAGWTAPSGSRRIVLIAVFALLLVGGSAAAYFGIVRPNNTPENILKKAVKNSLEQRRVSYDGSFSYVSLKEDNTAALNGFDIAFKGQGDLEKNNNQLEVELAASGVKLPVELRRLGKNFYIKFGDLASLKGAAALYLPNLGAAVEQVSASISNQWVEVDQSFLKQFKADCALDISLALTNDDIKLLLDNYQKSPFGRIRSTSEESLNGREAIKYDLEIDDTKAAAYSASLKELSIYKKLDVCYPEVSKNTQETKLANGDVMPLTLWVDKASKTIARVVVKTTERDEQQEGLKGSLEINTQFGGQINITKPETPKPILDVLTELSPVIQQLLGNGLNTTPQVQPVSQ